MGPLAWAVRRGLVKRNSETSGKPGTVVCERTVQRVRAQHAAH